MFSAISRHLFGAYAALLFLLILASHHSCSARKNNNYCAPSSCGNIRNISYPFRLNTDPKSCGHKNYELICENNRPTLYFKGGRYYVQEINYKNFTIRLVDAGLQKDDYFSLPQHSLNEDEFTDDIYLPYNFPSFRLTFLTCPNPIMSAIDILDASSCRSDTTCTFNITSPSSHDIDGYSYVMVVAHDMGDIPDLCHINLSYPMPFSFEHVTIISYLDFHDILEYGFELRWFLACCDFDKESRCDYFDEAPEAASCHEPPVFGVGDKIKDALAILATVVEHLITWSIRMYTSDEVWISYSRKDPQFEIGIYKDSFYHKSWTISSELLSILMLLLIALLVLTMIYHAVLFLCGFPCLITLLIYNWRRRHLSMYDNIEEFLQSHDHNLMPVRYSYSEIKKITNGFKEKLGEGGFGSVYKGMLRSGRFAAIKILGNSKANGQDFINEVASIGRIHHVNVVQLIGFTVEGSKRALVYEFMPNGSLEKYIFSRHGSIPLSNQKMYEISLGVARGIEYLHQGCDIQILHFDIKPHNILLDEKFVPKVSDFGLAKLYPTDNNMVSLTAARGTFGYMAPEMLYKTIGCISYKADVYSFGMLLMDMIGRRKNRNALANHSCQTYFSSWVYDQVSEGKDIELEDHTTEHEKRTTKKMIIVALWCIQLKPDDRPSMHKVVEMLEADIESLQMPPKPFFTPQHMPKDDDKANPIRLSIPPNDCIDSSYQYGR